MTPSKTFSNSVAPTKCVGRTDTPVVVQEVVNEPSDDRCARRVHPKFKKQLQEPLSTKLFFVHSVTNNTIDKVQLHELLYLTFMTKFCQPQLSQG